MTEKHIYKILLLDLFEHVSVVKQFVSKPWLFMSIF